MEKNIPFFSKKNLPFSLIFPDHQNLIFTINPSSSNISKIQTLFFKKKTPIIMI